MITLKITKSDWEVLKIKLRRKFNHLSEEDLTYQEGKESELIEKLAKRLRRSSDYLIFTLSKQLADLSNNRL